MLRMSSIPFWHNTTFAPADEILLTMDLRILFSSSKNFCICAGLLIFSLVSNSRFSTSRGLDFKISAIIIAALILQSILFLCFGGSLLQEQDWNLGLLLWVRHLIATSPTPYLTNRSYYLLSIYLLQVEHCESEIVHIDGFRNYYIYVRIFFLGV